MTPILSENRKTGISLNMPIEETCEKSCPFYQNRKCYGMKNTFRFKETIAANKYRFMLYKLNPTAYFLCLEAELATKPPRYVRINGVGDTPDKAWAERFVELARRHKSIKFWVSTRKSFWNDVWLPKNVVVRFADGLTGEHTSNVVYTTEQATCPATTKEAKNCGECGWKCWDAKVKHVSYKKH